MEEIEIALRCHVETEDGYKFNRKSYDELPRRTLTIDTETTADQYQSLLFGSFQIHDGGHLVMEGLFYGEHVTGQQLSVLRTYAMEHSLPLHPAQKFVDDNLLPEIYDLETVCIGFNLPFDLSRVALKVGGARGRNQGAFSFTMSEKKTYPHLIIKHNTDKQSFINFANGPSDKIGNVRKKKGSRSFKGHFVDLRTVAFTLTDKGHSLSSACTHFKTSCRKGETEEHGKVTPKYIDYNRQDVSATIALYWAVKEEYAKYGLELPMNRLYSPASLGKGHLNAMGIEPFMSCNLDFPKEVLGWTMQTFHGGRSEVRCRKIPMEVAYLDFLSMYPTVCILQDFWKCNTASHIDPVDDTEKVRAFIEEVNLDHLACKETWVRLNAICLVLPQEDILPVRAKFGHRDTYNTGIEYVTSDEPIWYALSDVIASKLLTGRCPQIVRAIRFVPSGVQEGLNAIRMIGGREIDPYRDDFYMALMEHRNQLKGERDRYDKDSNPDEYNRLDAMQKAVKIIANATAYGIFIEVNTSPWTGKEITAYGSKGAFPVEVSREEDNGLYYNPILATFITSAARLVLAITESILAKNGEHYMFCDTDSMGIPPSMVQPIQEYFQKLSPYTFQHELFKREKENFGDDKVTLEPLFFYGLSTKRYVLYNMRDGQPHIRKYSSHGLGHIRNPYKDVKNWEKEVWQDILKEAHGIAPMDGERYSLLYAISRITISTPEILRRFARFNQGNLYAKSIKPFNFMLVGYPTFRDPDTYQAVKPLAPYHKNASLAAYGSFIDYYSGREMRGHQYWKTLSDTIEAYRNKREEKFDGEVGVLERKHLIITNVRYIGKESNNLEMTEVLGVGDDDYIHYLSEEEKVAMMDEIKEFILQLKPKEARKYGIGKKQLQRMRAQIRCGKPLKLQAKTMRKLKEAIHHILDRYKNGAPDNRQGIVGM